MKIVCVGGGPAALYFSVLLKKACPGADLTVHERNRFDDAFGWGVVFSEETLGNLAEADPESFAAIRDQFVFWDDIEIHHAGACVRSTGHGFCGLSRKRLLMILQDRCRELGVKLNFQSEVRSLADLPDDADLVVGADGASSMVRGSLAESFRPRIDYGECRFSWLGTTLPLDAFTFLFHPTEHGLFQVHAYPFERGASTWIVECHEKTWRDAGLDSADESETVARCERLFGDFLRGHPLMSNRSVWRRFPTVTCERWHHGKVVLMGDAAHTAHFSIGSGTKLAMEDAIALARAFRVEGLGNVERALQVYREARYVEAIRTQKAAQTSQQWFENSSRYMGQEPVPFAFNLLTRSKRITYDNLRARDPQLVGRVTEWFRSTVGAPRSSAGHAPAPLFTPYRLRGMKLANRVVVSPMCQYSAVSGRPGDWHLVHLGARALGGAGLIMTEMTNVAADGRITPRCAGLYEISHVEAWKRIVDFVHSHSHGKIGIQLAHAGRKGACRHPWEGEDSPLQAHEGAWPTIGPSPLPFRPGWPAPREMNRHDMDRIRDAFVQAALWAAEAGFDLIELHAAHGYLLSSFISPLSNRRTDQYGGPLEHRMRFPLEVLRAVREVWPEEKPISVRISATDWMEDGSGLQPHDAVEVARMMGRDGCDIVDVSSGGNVADSKPAYGRMYQVPFAERIRYETGLPVIAVGAIQNADQANTILAAGRADLCAMARPHLADPHLTLRAAARYEYPDQHWPGQYLLGRPRSGGDAVAQEPAPAEEVDPSSQ